MTITREQNQALRHYRKCAICGDGALCDQGRRYFDEMPELRTECEGCGVVALALDQPIGWVGYGMSLKKARLGLDRIALWCPQCSADDVHHREAMSPPQVRRCLASERKPLPTGASATGTDPVKAHELLKTWQAEDAELAEGEASTTPAEDGGISEQQPAQDPTAVVYDEVEHPRTGEVLFIPRPRTQKTGDVPRKAGASTKEQE